MLYAYFNRAVLDRFCGFTYMERGRRNTSSSKLESPMYYAIFKFQARITSTVCCGCATLLTIVSTQTIQFLRGLGIHLKVPFKGQHAASC